MYNTSRWDNCTYYLSSRMESYYISIIYNSPVVCYSFVVDDTHACEHSNTHVHAHTHALMHAHVVVDHTQHNHACTHTLATRTYRHTYTQQMCKHNTRMHCELSTLLYSDTVVETWMNSLLVIIVSGWMLPIEAALVSEWTGLPGGEV